MWLIAGLGNPGEKYELTRHNFGFLAIDSLLERARETMVAKFQAEYARAELAGEACVLLKPQTFMNRSGQSVQAAMSFHKILPSQVIVLHDEIDVLLGEIRIKQGGSDGGHNGLKDITRLVGADYIRIRLGVGRPAFKGAEADFVLSRFLDSELSIVEDVLKHAMTAVDTLLEHGLERALQKCQFKKAP